MPKLVRNTVIASIMLMMLYVGMSAYLVVKGVGRIVGDGLRLVM